MIKALPADVVRKIAAGEVIENPASVVRELIENSIDANAMNVEVEVKGNGLELISVKDDGGGMTADDLKIVTHRYTTSKIESMEDLSKKFSLGFRGEALYSIAQVSKLTIISGTGDEAWKACYENEKVKNMEPYSLIKGTIIKVRDLFYNYPVRREYTESNSRKIKKELTHMFTNFLMAYPEVSFTIKWENKKGEVYPSRDIPIERYIELFGENFVREMKDFLVEEDDIRIYGFFKKPQYTTVKRGNLQYVFVNKRRVYLDFVRIAVRSAFGQENIIPEFIVYIELAPYLMDFNIHPQKKAVKIFNEKKLFSLIYHVVKRALIEERMILSDLKEGEKTDGKGSLENLAVNKGHSFVSGNSTGELLQEDARQLEFGEFNPHGKKGEGGEIPYYIPEKLFQIHNSYIVAEVKSGIIVVDQHAAHERIIYESLKKKRQGNKRLLFPISLELDKNEIRIFEEFKGILESMGFEFRYLGKSTVVIDSIPAVFDSIDKDIFKEILQDLEVDLNLPDKYQYTLKTIACKAAIKAGQPLSKEEMAKLLDDLFACDVPFFCPHGRPLIYKISLIELERKFGRT